MEARRLPSFLTGLCVLILACTCAATAQNITDYSFTASSGTYTPLVGGTVPTLSGSSIYDDGYVNGLPIGFSFDFNGTVYTQVSATTNGCLFPGATLSSSVLTNSLTSGTPRPIIAPLWDDLEIDTAVGGNLSYLTTGSPGTRVFTVQWSKVMWRYNTVPVPLSFQVNLYEADGKVEFIYFDEGGTPGNTPTASIGLSASASGSGNFLSLDGTGASPGVSSTAETANLSVKPASGQTYAFTRAPMVYTSSTVTQNTAAVSQGALNAQIIGVEIVMTGGASPLSATSFTFNTTGTTTAADIVNARLYYTGGSSTFTTAEQFGSTVASPSGTYTITGSRSLVGATNYFWLAYDIAAGATVGNQLDAQCTSLIVDGISRTPTVTAPAGNRTVQAALSGTYTIDPGGAGGTNYTTFTAAVADLNLLGISGPVTFNVKAGAVFTGAIDITATGTAARPIIFQRSGVGANPIVEETGTVATAEFIVKLTGSDYITFDGIDIRPTAGSAAMEWGYYFAGSATDGCQNNTVKNCVITMDKSNTGSRSVYLLSVATAASGANSGNTFHNNTIQNSYSGYYLTATAAFPDDGNQIGTSGGGTSLIRALGGASTASYGVYYGNQTTFKVFDTTVDSISTTSGTIGGIYNSGGVGNTVQIYDNTVKHLSTSSGTVYGIYGGSTGTTYAVYGNDVFGLTSSGSSMYGMYHGGGTVSVYKNRIHDLSYTGSSTSTIYGLYTAGGVAHNIYNNFIYDLRGPGSTSTTPITGMYLSSGTTINVFYNSILLNYASTAASNQSTALYVTVTPTSVDLRNNIFVNLCDMTTGTRAMAFRKSSTSLTNIAITTNNNLYYAGTPGPKNLIFYDGTNADTTLDAYKIRLGTRDQSAVTENPPFLSAVDPYNLHMSTSIQTQTESGGTPVTTPIAVADDIDGNARNAATPDIGGDEFSGIGLDVNPPSIVYTPLAGTGLTTARTLSTVITDATGVPTAGGGLPVLYWKINSGSWSAATAVHGAGSQYSFTFGGGVAVGDTVSYYIVARDVAVPVHIGSSPGGASGFTYDPPAASTPPVTPNSYLILTLVSSFPYNEDFEDSPRPESNGAGWTTGIVSGTVNDWERATPNKTFITHAHSGLKAFVTVDSGSYSLNHNAFIQAPILDFGGMTSDPVVDFYQNFFTELSWDAGVLEYSFDGGLTWRRADSTLGTGPNFNTLSSTGWYNNSGTTGPTPPPKWSDTSATKYASADSGWIRSTTVLNGAAGLSDVRVRWRFVTDGSVVRNGGWAIDDVSIYEGTGGVNIGVPIAAGWNMISNPVTTSADSVRQLFPTSSFNYAFSFAGAGGYQQNFRMLNTVGYWGKFPAATTATISGTSRTLDSVSVFTGWNMVGSISSAVDTSTIASVPPGIRSSTAWFGYAAGYVPAPFIVPGQAYWVKVSAPGKFVFSSGPAPEKAAAQGKTLGDLNSLTITDRNGASQTLYFGVDAEGVFAASAYEMPPPPPAGVLDARFIEGETGVLLQTLTAEAAGAEFPIALQAAAGPITLTWKLQAGEGEMTYTITDGAGGTIFPATSLRGDGGVTIDQAGLSHLLLKAGNGAAVPAEFALLQNYPNPFNPSTTIAFALPVPGRVRVEVYNLLGQRIATLINNEERKAGYHSVVWNGTGAEGLTVGSGVYFVRFAADGGSGNAYTEVRKMMFMK